jgi:hypothetical protein
VLARLSKGEHVIKASVAKRLRPLLDYINENPDAVKTFEPMAKMIAAGIVSTRTASSSSHATGGEIGPKSTPKVKEKEEGGLTINVPVNVENDRKLSATLQRNIEDTVVRTLREHARL